MELRLLKLTIRRSKNKKMPKRQKQRGFCPKMQMINFLSGNGIIGTCLKLKFQGLVEKTLFLIRLARRSVRYATRI